MGVLQSNSSGGGRLLELENKLEESTLRFDDVCINANRRYFLMPPSLIELGLMSVGAQIQVYPNDPNINNVYFVVLKALEDFMLNTGYYAYYTQIRKLAEFSVPPSSILTNPENVYVFTNKTSNSGHIVLPTRFNCRKGYYYAFRAYDSNDSVINSNSYSMQMFYQISRK